VSSTTCMALAVLGICAVVGATVGRRLAHRSRGWRAAIPITAVTAAAGALVLGYVASSGAIDALQSEAGAYGLRVEVAGGYGSLRSVVLSYAFLVVFPLGLVAGQLGAWVAHRRAMARESAPL
jgi:hypothetical protein